MKITSGIVKLIEAESDHHLLGLAQQGPGIERELGMVVVVGPRREPLTK